MATTEGMFPRFDPQEEALSRAISAFFLQNVERPAELVDSTNLNFRYLASNTLNAVHCWRYGYEMDASMQAECRMFTACWTTHLFEFCAYPLAHNILLPLQLNRVYLPLRDLFAKHQVNGVAWSELRMLNELMPALFTAISSLVFLLEHCVLTVPLPNDEHWHKQARLLREFCECCCDF